MPKLAQRPLKCHIILGGIMSKDTHVDFTCEGYTTGISQKEVAIPIFVFLDLSKGDFKCWVLRADKTKWKQVHLMEVLSFKWK